MKKTSIAAGVLLAATTPLATQPAHALSEHGEYANQQLEPYRNQPEFVAPGEPFDARACMEG